MPDAVYTVQLVAKVGHAAGPEPEWDAVARAVAAFLKGETLTFAVDTGPRAFAAATVTVDECEVDEAHDG